MQLTLANPRGFCAGVDRAIEIVERALEIFGAPIYVRHEVVHNQFVVNNLKEKGTIFVEQLDEVPDDATVIFSAHGVSKKVADEAASRGLQVFDATCPLVTKVHMEVRHFSQQGREAILIGHSGHPEVEGTMGRYDISFGGKIFLIESKEDVDRLNVRDPDALSYVTQTTLSVDDTAAIIVRLREKFPSIEGPKKDDICYATQNRQDAVKKMAAECDLMLVVGSVNSSNSNRLKELANNTANIPAYLIDSAADIDPDWITGKTKIGLTAGASAPEVLVRDVCEKLKELGVEVVEESAGIEEKVVFSLPPQLR